MQEVFAKPLGRGLSRLRGAVAAVDGVVAALEFQQALGSLRSLIEGDLAKLEKAMESAGAPWTPGRIPEWKDN